jgi:hypothetical protein
MKLNSKRSNANAVANSSKNSRCHFQVEKRRVNKVLSLDNGKIMGSLQPIKTREKERDTGHLTCEKW